MVPLTVLVLVTGGLATVGVGHLAVFAGLGLIGSLAYLLFYSALAVGPISLVSPIVSGYAACTVLAAVVLGSQQLSGWQWVAVAVTLTGVAAASLSGPNAGRVTARVGALGGIGLAVAAMVLFGGFVYGVSLPRAGLSWLAALFLARGFTGAFLLAQSGLATRSGGGRQPTRGQPTRARLTCGVVAIVALIAICDTGGYVCFDIGVRHAATAVVATASAPYSLVPVAVGVGALHERLKSVQWFGLALLCCGLIVLGASG
jgi:drug/metabolite transporter (DMT)-like permease